MTMSANLGVRRLARRRLLALAGLSLPGFGGFLVGCAAPSVGPNPALAREFAPSGSLRAAINLGNPILASTDAQGALVGVSVDLARELARRLGVPVQLIEFAAAGRTVDAVREARVDVAFVAVDPVRGADIAQTHPYVIIEGAYLVRNGSSLRANADVDRAGTRIMVARGSAYDLFLSRELNAATLVRTQTSQQVVDAMLAQNVEVAAGVRQQLEMDARRISAAGGTVRVLDGRFMVIQQAMALPKGREAAHAALNRFVEEMKASGFVAQALARHRIDGAAVAPGASR